MEKIDIYTYVTNKIIEQLTSCNSIWRPSWQHSATPLPRRVEGSPYHGINVLLLWSEAFLRGYSNPTWLTYRQAQILGGQVRKNERSSQIIYANGFPDADDRWYIVRPNLVVRSFAFP